MGKESVSLRLLRKKDVNRMLEWMHSSTVTEFLRLDGKNTTEDDALKFIVNAQDQQINAHYAIVDANDVYQGTISLKNIDNLKGEAEYAIALHPSAIGNGIALLATKKILRIAFSELNLNQIYLNVLENNIRAIKFYEKVGFKYNQSTDIIFKDKIHKLRWYIITKEFFYGLHREKIVFFYEKDQVIAGSLIFYMMLSKAIAHRFKEYQVYYVNYPNKTLEDMYLDETVTCCDITTCDFSQFENARFVVPLNYLFAFLARSKGIKSGSILLFDWHPELATYLSNQFFWFYNSCENLLAMFDSKKALSFMDKSCAISVYKLLNKTDFIENYIPVFVSGNKNEPIAVPSISKNTLRIGWLGRLDSDKINSLINLLEMLLLLDSDVSIDVHVIGDGDSRNKINLRRYAPKIRIIFTSYLVGEIRDKYIKENIDIMVTMGIAALDVANLCIPTIIPIMSSRPFNNDQFVFLFDTIGFSLGWTNDDLKRLGCKSHRIKDVLNMVYNEGRKEQLGRKCYDYMKSNFDIDKSTELMVCAVENSELTLEDCRNNVFIEKQLGFFGCYQKIRRSKHRTYSDYVLLVNRINAIRKKSTMGKIKGIIKIFTNPLIQECKGICLPAYNKVKYLKQKYYNIKEYNRVQKSYPIKIENIKKQLLENKKIKVAFLVIFKSVFPCEPIFEKMLKDEFFDPYIIVIPDMQRSLRHRIQTFEESFEELYARYGDRVLRGYDIETAECMELGEIYPLVFFNNPYSKMAHFYHHITYFKDKNVLTMYVNYGFFTVKFGRTIVKTDFYNYLWKVCIDSEINFLDVTEHQAIKGSNAMVTGYVKMDKLKDATIHKKNRKLVIISPHHTVLGWKALDISNFLSYSDFFVRLPSMFPEIDFVFRPHPLLFSNLLDNKIWSKEEIDDYLKRIQENTNLRYDDSGEYLELFANSDAMIHDCASFIGEYLFTEKPCCYMLKNKEEINEVLLPMGMKCMENYYKAYCEEDIVAFLNEVVVKGIDPLKDKRVLFSKNELKFNYPNATDMVIETIKEALGKK